MYKRGYGIDMHSTGKPNIWERLVSDKPFFVAEIGKNFIQSREDQTSSEYFQNAKELIRAAADAGADAVKFQTHWVDDEQLPIKVISPHFNGADRYAWVRRNTEATPLRFWQDLKACSERLGMEFFSTPMSRGAAELLNDVGVSMWKVGSGDLLDFVLLDWLRRRSEPIIISSGMSSLEEVDAAISFLSERTDKVVLLHCISQYPCAPADLHLGAIPFFQNRYRVPVGFSDHSIGIDAALHAVALGAVVIEKHFSLSRELWGSDHKVSMLPAEFAHMVARARAGHLFVSHSQEYMGEDIVHNLPDSKSQFRGYFRKTLVASRAIAPGEIIFPEMVYAMRPQAFVAGLPSERYPEIVGAAAATAISARQSLTEENVIVRASALSR